MKKLFILFSLALSMACIAQTYANSSPDVRLTDCHLGGRVQSAPSQAAHSDHVFDRGTAKTPAQQWMESGAWRNGFMANPFAGTDAELFYDQYQKAPAMWDSIFTWLATIDPVAMEPSKKAMVWSHAYAKVLDQDLRTPENCQWEQHQRTIDLQWDATCSERYLLTRQPEILTAKNEYNEKKDVQNFRFSRSPQSGECVVLDSNPQTFFLFFPNDIHQACGIAHDICMPRKIVVKIDLL